MRGSFQAAALIELPQRIFFGYRAGLMKRSGIFQEPVHPLLLNAFQSFLLRAFCFELALSLFFFKLGLPLDTPFILPKSALTILDFGSEDDLNQRYLSCVIQASDRLRPPKSLSFVQSPNP